MRDHPMDERLEAYRLLISDVYELAGASRRTSDRIAAELGHTAARWRVMIVIRDQPRPVPAIARRLGLTRQGVQRVVNDLVGVGVVVLVDNPGHARSPLVSLTPEGEDLLVELFRRSESSRIDVIGRAAVGTEQLNETRRVVRALTAALSE